MKWPPSGETLERLGWVLSGLFFLLAIVSFLGEVLGWWNDLGEVGMIVGTLAGLLVAIGALVGGAGRRQVTSVHSDLRSVGTDVRAVHSAVESNGIQLRKLGSIEEKLGKLDTLDKVHVALEAQTGVLDRQADILEAIRDGL